MAFIRQSTSYLFGCLLAIFLLSGCAVTTTSSSGDKLATTEQRQATPADSAAFQQAMNAFEESNFQLAVDSFEQAQQQEMITADSHFYYAHALLKTGHYAAAIKQYTDYIETLGRSGDNFLAALDERIQAKNMLQQQRVTALKTEQAQKAFLEISAVLENNWQQVQKQLRSHAATFIEPLTGIEMILVKGGCYQLANNKEACVEDFYLGKYEVTQAQWQRVMGYNPAQSNQGDKYPVDSLSWLEAVEFADKLGGATGGYRLPSEAEWEFTARSGGRKQLFSGSNVVAQVAWFEGNSGGGSHPVGQKKPNGLGFFDMSGNLYEWCLDQFQPPGDVPATQIERIRRGGSWDSRSAYNRTSYRTSGDQSVYRDRDTGFRLALPLTDQ